MKRVFFNLVFLGTWVSASTQAATLQGQVNAFETEDPIAEAQIVVHGTQFSTLTDASGQYLIDNLPAGTYRISCHHKSYLGYQESWVGVETQRVVDFGLRLPEADHARVKGTITCDANPCAGVIIKALRNGSIRALSVSSADGSYVMTGLPKGEYQIHAMAFGHLPGSADDVLVTIESETEPQIFERNIQLASAGGFSIKTRVGLRDNPLDKSGSVVTINGQIPSLSTQTDKGGDGVLSGVPAGPLSFTTTHDGYQPSTRLDVMVDGDMEIAFALNELPDPDDPRFSVYGTVELDENAADPDPEGSRVSLWSPNGQLRYTTYTNPQGRYTLSNIRAADGPFQAGAAREGFLSQVVESFTLQSNKTIDFQLSLDPDYKPAGHTGPADFGCSHPPGNQSTGLPAFSAFLVICAMMRIRKWILSKKTCLPK